MLRTTLLKRHRAYTLGYRFYVLTGFGKIVCFYTRTEADTYADLYSAPVYKLLKP